MAEEDETGDDFQPSGQAGQGVAAVRDHAVLAGIFAGVNGMAEDERVVGREALQPSPASPLDQDAEIRQLPLGRQGQDEIEGQPVEADHRHPLVHDRGRLDGRAQRPARRRKIDPLPEGKAQDGRQQGEVHGDRRRLRPPMTVEEMDHESGHGQKEKGHQLGIQPGLETGDEEGREIGHVLPHDDQRGQDEERSAQDQERGGDERRLFLAAGDEAVGRGDENDGQDRGTAIQDEHVADEDEEKSGREGRIDVQVDDEQRQEKAEQQGAQDGVAQGPQKCHGPYLTQTGGRPQPPAKFGVGAAADSC